MNSARIEMADEPENISGQQIQSVPIAFAADELSACGKCGRDNAPNRMACIYCGAELTIREEFLSQAKVAANDLEADALGWNIVARAADVANADSDKELESLSFLVEDIRSIGISNTLIPIARFATKQAAELAQKRLATFPIALVSDEILDVSKAPVRVSRIEFDGADLAFTDFNRGTIERCPAAAVTAIVLGTLHTFTTTTLEKRGIRKRSTVTDETSDDRVSQLLEIHIQDSPAPFAVHPTGFDFSILAAERSLLVSENFERLAAKLGKLAPQARIVTDHNAFRNTLRGPWPETSRSDGLGRVRTGIGQRRYGRTATVDNKLQFAKFSRLQALDLDELKR